MPLQSIEEVQDKILEILDEYPWEEEGFPDVRFDTFANAGLLTDNRGIVARFGNDEFQMQIVRSR